MITPKEKYNLDKNTERARERDAFWWNGDLKPSTKPAMKYIMSNKMSFKSCLLFISHTKFDLVLLCSCAELPLVFLVFKERNELNMYMYRRTARSVTMVFCKKKTKQQNILNSNGFWRHNEQVSRIIRTTTIINRIWNQQSNKGFFCCCSLIDFYKQPNYLCAEFRSKMRCKCSQPYHILLVYLSIPWNKFNAKCRWMKRQKKI